MLRILPVVIVTAVVVSGCELARRTSGPAANPQLGRVRHVVLFKFKDATAPEQVKAIEDGFRALPGKIPGIVAFDWGRNISPENLAQGFTHCFLVTFKDAAARDGYLPHPEHKAFANLLGPHLDKVLVIDYVAKR